MQYNSSLETNYYFINIIGIWMELLINLDMSSISHPLRREWFLHLINAWSQEHTHPIESHWKLQGG